MSVFLITYDLSKPGQDYSSFYEMIKKHSWAKLSESSYAISTSETVNSIYENLRKHMDANDQIYVIKLSAPHMGFGPTEVNNWISTNL